MSHTWQRFHEWMRAVAVVTFDLELGQKMEYCFPETVRVGVTILAFTWFLDRVLLKFLYSNYRRESCLQIMYISSIRIRARSEVIIKIVTPSNVYLNQSAPTWGTSPYPTPTRPLNPSLNRVSTFAFVQKTPKKKIAKFYKFTKNYAMRLNIIWSQRANILSALLIFVKVKFALFGK